MTPQRAGWLAGLLVFALLLSVELAVAVLSPAAGESGGAGAVFSVVIRVVLLAVAAGVLVTRVAASRQGRRTAVVAAGSAYVVIGGCLWWLSTASPRAPGEDPAGHWLGLLATFMTIGTVFALASALVAWWIARHAVGRDGAERALALETSNLAGSRDGWGMAMRAELASIDDPVQRRRFARSTAALALRQGTGKWPAWLAVIAGICAGSLVYTAARISFDRPRDRGIVGEPILGLVLLIVVAAVIAGTLIGRSFRAGLETAVLTWLAVYICSVAVGIPQAIAWFNADGILLLDGEGAAGAGVDAVGAALQPITHFAFIFMSASLLVGAVFAAAFGAVVLRVMGAIGRRAATQSLSNSSSETSSGPV